MRLPAQVVQSKVTLLLCTHFSSDVAETAVREPLLFGALKEPKVMTPRIAKCLCLLACAFQAVVLQILNSCLQKHSLPTSLMDAHTAFTMCPTPRQEDDGDMLCAYADIGTHAAAQGIFQRVLAKYNRKCKPMRLVFFDDALDQLLRMHRTFCLPQVQACSHESQDLQSSVAWTHRMTCTGQCMTAVCSWAHIMLGIYGTTFNSCLLAVVCARCIAGKDRTYFSLVTR